MIGFTICLAYGVPDRGAHSAAVHGRTLWAGCSASFAVTLAVTILVSAGVSLRA